jgi:hypothetical protein
MPSVLADELDRTLVGLGARVAEERLAAEARAAEPLRELHSALGQVEVRRVGEHADLLANRLDHRRMTVADRADRDAGEEIEVFLAVRVPEPRPLAADELDGCPRVGLHQPARVQLL